MGNGFLLPVSGLMILGLANLRGWLSVALSNRYLILLGEASYAIYLLHIPIWYYFERIHPIDSMPRWMLFMAILLVASMASFVWVERPARRAILHLMKSKPRVALSQESATQY